MTEIKDRSFLERLNLAQTELRAPKGQFNKFGNYNYRSAEDIKEAAKPVNLKYGLALTESDEMVEVGNRIYVKATCTLRDVFGDSEPIVVTAYAREAENKKGMDDSQITGAASSYARKYALNGLYLIDDTKDADTNEHHNQMQNTPTQQAPKKISGAQVGSIRKVIKTIADLVGQTPEEAEKVLLNASGTGGKLEDLDESQFGNFLNYLNRTRAKYQEAAKKKQEQKAEQTSLMDGNTTTPKGDK